MGVMRQAMRMVTAALSLALASAGQSGAQGGGKPAGAASAGNAGTSKAGGGRAGLGAVQFDEHGWPIVPTDVAPPAAARGGADRSGAGADAPPAAPGAEPAGSAGVPDATPVASGMQLGSPLLDVFRATRPPGAFQQLGGVVVWWRLTVHGTHGEVIGVREVTHTADCARADRDRLDYEDGRSFGRLGEQVFAERSGMPWPTLEAAAAPELTLFGMHLRMPWCFADAAAFAAVRHDVVEQNGERFTRVVLERRPPPALDIAGPDPLAQPRDRFELWFEPGTGLPRQLIQRLAASRQQRRVLLEDWREVGGVRLPHRRVYVDEALRPTTTLELLRVEQRRTTDRDFRLR